MDFVRRIGRRISLGDAIYQFSITQILTDREVRGVVSRSLGGEVMFDGITHHPVEPCG